MTAAQMTTKDLEDFVWLYASEIIDILTRAYDQTLRAIIDVHLADELVEWAADWKEQ